ncbi:MAG: ATP-binding protein [Smithellaceae bacterium]|nr:hypothetical protein [Syntrophaceae bacterium]MDD4241058.1 ATP-binding protein [Smithellaceae bacterium]NLX51307.1 hypothetical protein [Deltaproteobacteria bacterium]
MPERMTAIKPDKRRLSKNGYYRRLNLMMVYACMPGLLFYAGFYFYLRHYFHAFLFIFMFINAFAAVLVGVRLPSFHLALRHHRITAGIGFGLFAVNLLTGLWDPSIYYIVFPWIVLFPLAAVIILGRYLGLVTAAAFSSIALIFFLLNDLPPFDAYNTKLFKFNAIAVLVFVLTIAAAYEKIRMKIHSELVFSENQYLQAVERQLQTNRELEQEIERRSYSEKALAESELHYRALFAESVVPLWEEDWSQVKTLLDNLPASERENLACCLEENPELIEQCASFIQITAVNQATLKICEADTQSVFMENWERLIAPDRSGFLARRIASVCRTGRYTAQVEAATLNGNRITLLVSSMVPAGYEASWQRIFSSVYDITERIAMEREKKIMEMKMENMRQIQATAKLAGGIAHQFNNALAVINGSLEMLSMNGDDHPESRKFLASLKTSADRMSRLTDQLLAYAEGGKYQPRHFSVNDVVNDVVHAQSLLMDSDTDIIQELDDDAGISTGDIIQIKMAVEAVVANALEALPQGGLVKISTGRMVIGPASVPAGQTVRPGAYVFIRVKDSGVGMDRETVQRIFEPFFTTKVYGRGLGMAAAFGILKNHDGWITVDSGPGRGTSVDLFFPAADPPRSVKIR